MRCPVSGSTQLAGGSFVSDASAPKARIPSRAQHRRSPVKALEFTCPTRRSGDIAGFILSAKLNVFRVP